MNSHYLTTDSDQVSPLIPRPSYENFLNVSEKMRMSNPQPIMLTREDIEVIGASKTPERPGPLSDGQANRVIPHPANAGGSPIFFFFFFCFFFFFFC